MFFKNLSLEKKFNTLLIIVFICCITLSGLILSWILQQRAQAEVQNKAQLLIEMMNSVRDYTSNQITPLLDKQLETEPIFIPETVPAYSATEVFQTFRKDEAYQDFFYKEATVNPSNLRDQADEFEKSLVDRFRQKPNLKEISGFRDLPGGQIFYIAHPISVKEESCLRCHGNPADAPKSHITAYGVDNGYGWKLNEVIASQIISVPSEEVFNNAHRSLAIIMAMIFGVFVLLMILINYLLKSSVIRPIRRLAKTAEAVSMGQMDAEFTKTSKDEIGTLADAFSRMKASLEISINLLNKRNK